MIVSFNSISIHNLSGNDRFDSAGIKIRSVLDQYYHLCTFCSSKVFKFEKKESDCDAPDSSVVSFPVSFKHDHSVDLQARPQVAAPNVSKKVSPIFMSKPSCMTIKASAGVICCKWHACAQSGMHMPKVSA